MILNLKIFTFLMTWLVSTITMTAFAPAQLKAQEISPSSFKSGLNNSLLLAQSEQQQLDAFFDSGKYSYCDAKVLANYWGQSVTDAKARIGYKLLSGREAMSVLDEIQGEARTQATDNLRTNPELCFFQEKGYVYNDAVALARYWGLSTPYDGKLQAEKLLILGQYRTVSNALSAGRNM